MNAAAWFHGYIEPQALAEYEMLLPRRIHSCGLRGLNRASARHQCMPAGHFIPEELPRETAQALRAFFT